MSGPSLCDPKDGRCTPDNHTDDHTDDHKGIRPTLHGNENPSQNASQQGMVQDDLTGHKPKLKSSENVQRTHTFNANSVPNLDDDDPESKKAEQEITSLLKKDLPSARPTAMVNLDSDVPSLSPTSHAGAVDSLLQKMWDIKIFSVTQFIVVNTCYCAAIFQLFCNIFTAHRMDHKCADWNISDLRTMYNSSNLSMTVSSCDVVVVKMDNGSEESWTMPCSTWEYDTHKKSSIVSDFDLVCDKKSLGPLLQSLFIAGQGIGAIVFPVISDKLGRRPALLATNFGIMAFSVAQAFAPSYAVMAFYKVMIGAFQQGIVLIASTMCIEIFPQAWRQHVIWLNILTLIVCNILLLIYTYLLRHADWSTVLLALSSASIFIIPVILLMEETFVWLVANGKKKRAQAFLKRACWMNRIDLAPVLRQFEETVRFSEQHVNDNGHITRIARAECEGTNSIQDTNTHFLEADGTPFNDSFKLNPNHSRVKHTRNCNGNGIDGDGNCLSTTLAAPSDNEANIIQDHIHPKGGDHEDKSADQSHSLLTLDNKHVQISPTVATVSTNSLENVIRRCYDSGNPRETPVADSIEAPTKYEMSKLHGDLDDEATVNGELLMGISQEPEITKTESEAVIKAKSSNLFQMFFNWHLCVNIVVFWVVWAVDSFSYFMFFLTTGMLADNLYMNFFYNALAELPSLVLLLIVPARLGRKASLILFHILSGSMLIVATVIKTLSDGVVAKAFATTAGIAGKIGVAAAFNLLFAYTPEAFPTNMRTLAIGSSSTMCRIGAALAPFVILLPSSISRMSSISFGIISLGICLIVPFLPETKGRALPQTVDDVNAWYSNSVVKRRSKKCCNM